MRQNAKLMKCFIVVLCKYRTISGGEGGIKYSKSRVRENGNSGFPIGTQASLSCLKGYDLSGPSSITCQNSGLWSLEAQTYCNPSKTR